MRYWLCYMMKGSADSIAFLETFTDEHPLKWIKERRKWWKDEHNNLCDFTMTGANQLITGIVLINWKDISIEYPEGGEDE